MGCSLQRSCPVRIPFSEEAQFLHLVNGSVCSSPLLASMYALRLEFIWQPLGQETQVPSLTRMYAPVWEQTRTIPLPVSLFRGCFKENG